MKKGSGALAPRRSMRASASAVLAYAARLRALRSSALPSPQTPGRQTTASLRAGLASGLSPTFFISLLADSASTAGDLDGSDLLVNGRSGSCRGCRGGSKSQEGQAPSFVDRLEDPCLLPALEAALPGER